VSYALVRDATIPGPAPVGGSEEWSTWARELLGSEQGRKDVRAAWVSSVVGLERIKSVGVSWLVTTLPCFALILAQAQVPQIAFHSLTSNLSSPSTTQIILETGSVIIRDVVPDPSALSWAADVVRATNERDGHPVFWHPALLAARAHPSVLSANKQVLDAIAPEGAVSQAEPYILADCVKEGFEAVELRGIDLASQWTAFNASTGPCTPILAHLALTPASGFLPPTLHSALYSSLRPLFRPLRSRLSFYHPSAYLDPSNWALLDVDDIASSTASTFTSTSIARSAQDLPHLGGTASKITLEAGDVLYHHPSIPLIPCNRVGEEGLALPVSPLPTQSKEYVARQRESFENGRPPPHVRAVGVTALEAVGVEREIRGSGGRKAMGY
jgi:hypothetical protein